MALSNQFALTVELTRLVPIASVADKAAQAFIRWARGFRHSGSDVIVEEDLVAIFGRCRIAPSLDSSFRTIIAKEVSNTSLWEGIVLQGGPGPTVIRSFQETPYFSMVVQLSLLVWCYETRYLATAIQEAMEKRLDGAPALSKPNLPSRENIAGVLRVCESQTSAFDWNMMLFAVAHSLEYPLDRVRGHLPATILQGLLDMFPMVQSLPEDRVAYIQILMQDGEIDPGICSLVVWAHNVLDLTVLVKKNQRREYGLRKDVRFGGASSDQVIIEEISPDDDPAISLLDPLHEKLLTIKPDPETGTSLIGSVQRVPARGWGTALITDSVAHLYDHESKYKMAMRELQVICCAFALMIATHLFRDDSERLDLKQQSYASEGFPQQTSDIPCYTDPLKIFVVANVLFEDARIMEKDVHPYLIAYSSKVLGPPGIPVPITFAAASKAQNFSEVETADHWDIICRCLRQTSVCLIAFAHVLCVGEFDSMVFLWSSCQRSERPPSGSTTGRVERV